METTHHGLPIMRLNPGDPLPTGEAMAAVEVTPALAKDWLDRFTDPQRRNIRPSRVASYTQDMVDGVWAWTPVPIIFTVNGGDLMDDGHHRMTSIVGADVPIWLAVSFGNDHSVRPVIDRGAPRSIADVLRLEGHGAGYAGDIAAIIKVRSFYDRTKGSRAGWTNSATLPIPSSSKVLATVEARATFWHDVGKTARHLAGAFGPGIIPPSAGGAFISIAEDYAPGTGLDFANRVADASDPYKTPSRRVGDDMRLYHRNKHPGTNLNRYRWLVEALLRAYKADVKSVQYARPTVKKSDGLPFLTVIR